MVPVRVSAENAVAMRSEPDEDGWISITSEPVEEKDLNTLVAAAMENPPQVSRLPPTPRPRSRRWWRPSSISIPASSCLKIR